MKNREQFHKDIRTLKNRMVEDIDFATDIYRALCNMQWKDIDGDYIYGCTWRYAGGLVAEIRDKGEDYLEFYCSGAEGSVTKEIEEIFNNLGWEMKSYD